MDEVPNSEFCNAFVLLKLALSFVWLVRFMSTKPCARSVGKQVFGRCTPSSDSLYFFSPVRRKKGEEAHDIIVEIATKADVWCVDRFLLVL
jgi:hypothetical protein